MKKLLLLMFLIMILFSNTACQSENEISSQNITPEEAHQRLQKEKDIILLDVRTQEEYEQQHIVGSTLLPLDNLKDGIGDIVREKDTTIFVYCRSGNRSATASKILRDIGYTSVYDMGGIIDWKYETESNK